jgi:methylenetetrahydrofolate dehydrogenase (NADP+)/methenyltetrahydrofolate cyclohydrolase
VPAQIIDGNAISEKMITDLTAECATLGKDGKKPHLVAVQCGDPPASRIYVNNQKKQCEAVGLKYTLDQLAEDASEGVIMEKINDLNNDPGVHGIILQMPLPQGVDAKKIQATITPHKDPEGMNPINFGGLIYGKTMPGPCTAVGAVELLKSTGVKVEGVPTVIIGHSEIVGKPVVNILLGMNATVSCCHIFTDPAYLKEKVKEADILFIATGKRQYGWSQHAKVYKAWYADPDNNPKPDMAKLHEDMSPLVTADMIKPGAVVIDIATNRIPAGFGDDDRAEPNKKGNVKIVTRGDADFAACKEIAGYITPVPGGVGPMTTAILLRNCVELAKATFN